MRRADPGCRGHRPTRAGKLPAPAEPPATMNDADHTARPALLPFLAVLRFQGPDAATFLQGQVTHDTRLLGDGRTLLAAVNNPQGRVVALLRLSANPGGVDALLPADLAEAVVARLRKFVLRARVDVR